jgi:hypothetical protein
MLYLILILCSVTLLTGFVLLVRYEEQHAVRFFAPKRSEFDVLIERMQFIIQHVDLAAFLQEELRRALTALGHAVVNVSLQAVRSVERLLTRLVRHLRTRSENAEAPLESTREFVKTLSDFKDTLKTSYPAMPEAK